MKSFFLTLVLCSTVLFSVTAQNTALKRAEEIKQLMWQSDDAGFKVTEVPEKYKKESAVILCQSNYFEYRKDPMVTYVNQKEHVRRRVKLMDKSSLEEYSEMSYPSGSEYFFGIKIIKPTGKEVEVDLKDAVPMEKAVNNSYGGTYNIKYFKIAIPSLEVGDIIDYYTCMENIIYVPYKIHTFSTVIYTLQSEYPILKQTLEFKLQRRCFLNIKEYNNSPHLKMKEDPKGDAVIYSMTDTDRDKVADKLWHFPYRSLPTIKFQVRYAAPSTESAYEFLGEPTVPKTSISKEELIKYVNKKISGSSFYSSAALKKVGKEKDPDKIAEIVYNYIRFQKPYSYYSSSDVEFLRLMTYVLKSKKIPHQVVITVPRNISSLDDAVMEAEFSFLLKINTAKPYYVSTPGNHSLIKDLDESFQGVDGYALNLADKKLKNVAERVKIPVIPHTENNTTQKFNVTINDDFSALKTTVEVILKGENKTTDQNNLLTDQDYKEEEYKRLNEKNPSKSNQTNLKASVREEAKKKEEREKEDVLKAREERLKQIAEGEYDAKILSVKNFVLKQDGRWSDKPEMIYLQDIEMEGLVKRVGPNYILEAGKLIGEQVELSEDDKDRKLDIYMPYARSFNNEITIKIPDGYTVEGLESFKINKANKTGGFVSSAKIEGDKVVISTSKYYVTNFVKVEDWKSLEEFLEAAYTFTQQKLLLKKK